MSSRPNRLSNPKETPIAVKEQRFRIWNRRQITTKGDVTSESYARTIESSLRNLRSQLSQKIESPISSYVKKSAFAYLNYEEFNPICSAILKDSTFQRNSGPINHNNLREAIIRYQRFLYTYHESEEDYEKFAHILYVFIKQNKKISDLAHANKEERDFADKQNISNNQFTLSSGLKFTFRISNNSASSKPNSTYVNVTGTDIKIRPSFSEPGHITTLSAGWYPEQPIQSQTEMSTLTCSVTELDLSARKPSRLVRQMLDLLVELNERNKSQNSPEEIDINYNMTKEQYVSLSERAKQLLEDKNIIFHGAPGTGKTTVAREIASELLCINNEDGQIHKQLSESPQFEFVQFHPSYDYTDFVEGLRPETTKSGNVGFQLYPGIFTKFINKAKRDLRHNYVIIIDEINRGDLSKILGELFFSIDPDYRGERGSVDTQYANLHSLAYKKRGGLDEGEKFYIPENVYIIGTMNDIDRSVDSFDFAMRRRFTFIEISAEESAEALNGMPNEDRTKSMMKAVNSEISEFLGTDYVLGVGYFLKTAQSSDDNASWELWKNHLEPLLADYLGGMDDADEKLSEIFDAFKEAAFVSGINDRTQGDNTPTVGDDAHLNEA